MRSVSSCLISSDPPKGPAAELLYLLYLGPYDPRSVVWITEVLQGVIAFPWGACEKGIRGSTTPSPPLNGGSLIRGR